MDSVQAELVYVWVLTMIHVFAADLNCLKVPAELDDERVVLLSDILPTAWHANELGQVGEGDNVAIWGAGPGALSCLSPFEPCSMSCA